MLNADGNKSGRHLSKIVCSPYCCHTGCLLSLVIQHNSVYSNLENGYNLTLEVSAANLWTYMRMKEKRVKQR